MATDVGVVELARAIKREDAKAVVAAANKVLITHKGDADAMEARAVALLEEGKWEEAVNASVTPALAVHKAYALYRSDKFDAALALVAGVATPPARHLRAQILFRMGKYDESAAVYDDLLKGLEEEDGEPAEIDEVRLNLAAAYVAAERSADLVAHPSFADILDTLRRGKAEKSGYVFELLYNVACALIEAGDPALAMRALVASYTVGHEELTEAEDMTPPQVAEELAMVRAQAAYLLQLARYDDAAASLYSQVLAMNTRDAALSTVIHANLTAARHDGRALVDGYKRLKGLASSPTATAKLLRRQVVSLHYNHAVLAFLLKKWDEVRAAIASLRSAAATSGGANYPVITAALRQAEVLELANEVAAAMAPSADIMAPLLAKLTALAAATPTPPAPAATAVTLSPALAMRVHLLLVRGAAPSAADELLAAFPPGSLPHPAAASTVVQVLVAANAAAAIPAFLDSAVRAWLAVVPMGPTTPATKASGKAGVLAPPLSHATACAVALLHIRAATLLARGDVDGAMADLQAVTRLGGVTGEERGVALATMAMAQAQSAQKAPVAERGALLAQADVLLKEATAVAVGAGSRKPSFADLSRFNNDVIDALEWRTTPADKVATASTSKKATTAAGAGTPPPSTSLPSTSRALAVGGPLPATASGAAAAASPAVDEAAAAKAAALKAVAKRRVLRRRAKRRDAFLAALKARTAGAGGAVGIATLAALPKPDPERWLPKRERTHGRKGKKKGGPGGKGYNVSSGGAQGVTGASEALSRELDAKAKADAAKAKADAAKGKGGAAAGGAGASAPEPAGKATGKAGGKGKGGKKR